jgi:hypothetical protein
MISPSDLDLFSLSFRQAKYKYTAGSGTLEYLPTEHCLEWKIERFAGNTSLVLKAEVNMTASIKEKAWSRPPITMDFQVPMYTSSGLHVRFLKVFEKCTLIHYMLHFCCFESVILTSVLLLCSQLPNHQMGSLHYQSRPIRNPHLN